MRTLRPGDSGDDVRMMQHLLNTALRPSPGLRMTGYYGDRTRAAVARYQERHGLAVTGVADRHTLLLLGMRSRAAPIPVGATSSAWADAWAGVRRTVADVVEHVVDAFDGDDAPPAAPATPAPAVPARPSASPAAAGAATPRLPGGRTPIDPTRLRIDREREMPWMRLARMELGVTELRRAGQHNPRIVEYHQATHGRFQDDETPWCASFVNWVLQQANVRGTRSAGAISFADWGVATEAPPIGAIVVLRRRGSGRGDRATGSGTGNHVAFLADLSDTHITLLGGNQSGGTQVSQVPYRLASYWILGVRLPG